jgi:hypothetical protein
MQTKRAAAACLFRCCSRFFGVFVFQRDSLPPVLTKQAIRLYFPKSAADNRFMNRGNRQAAFHGFPGSQQMKHA